MGTTASVKTAIKEGFRASQKQGKAQIIQCKREAVEPSREFDLNSYLSKRCRQEEQGSFIDFIKLPDKYIEKVIIKAKQQDLKGLTQEGPFEVDKPSKYPYSAVGMVFSKAGGHPRVGTGCLVGPNIVLTCAHNCFNLKTKQMHGQIEFIPSAIEKYTRLGFRAKAVYIPQQYKRGDYEQHPKYNRACLFDYAILLLDAEQNLEEWFGSFGYDFSWQESQEYMRQIANNSVFQGYGMCGYNTLKYGGVQYKQYRGSVYSDDYYLLYSMKTAYGVSGAPVFTKTPAGYTIRAIHQRDIFDILQPEDINCHRKAGLKLRREMVDDIKENFRIRFRNLCFEKKGINADHMSLIIKEINRYEKQAGCREFLSLNFTNNTLGDIGCLKLSQAKQTNVQQLILWSNGISSKGCEYLSKGHWPSLKHLNLRNNCIDHEGCMFLAKTDMKNLEILDIWKNTIGDKGCQHLAQAEWSHLHTINLRNNQIGDRGCYFIAIAPWKALQQLNLRSNKITDKGCETLSNGNWESLHLLNLRSNFITDKGCYWLSRALWTQFEQMDLLGNQITKEGEKQFKGLKWKIYWDGALNK